MNISKIRSLQRVILDEISLEGLEGITLESLWVYLSKYLNIPIPLPNQLKENVWSFILTVQQHLNFFELPEERHVVNLFDRYNFLDNDLSIPLSPEICPFVRYKCSPITDGAILGSCEWYKERKIIPFDLIKDFNVETVWKIWANKLVVVASQELRYNALTPENITRPKDLTPIQYCIWEAIGRSRYNGETTSGEWSLTHFCKDPTIVFYIKTSSRSNKGAPPKRYGYEVCVSDGPISYKEAALRPDNKEWFNAMRQELKALQVNNTWDLLELP